MESETAGRIELDILRTRQKQVAEILRVPRELICLREPSLVAGHPGRKNRPHTFAGVDEHEGRHIQHFELAPKLGREGQASFGVDLDSLCASCRDVHGADGSHVHCGCATISHYLPFCFLFFPLWVLNPFRTALNGRMSTDPKGKPTKTLVDNRRARHEYTLFESFEAGLSLLGSEVKSLRGGKAQLHDAYVRLDAKGAWLEGCHIATYEQANRQNHEPMRARQLLLHSHELTKLWRATRQKGMTVVPLRLFLRGSHVKLAIALAKGKKLHDKRQTLKERDAKRDIERGQRQR